MRGVKRPVPEDFAEQAAVLGVKELQRHYSTGDQALARWFRETGVRPLSRSRSMPEDFAENAARMTLRGLTKLYHTNHRTASRWAREIGVEIRKGTVPPRIPVPDDFAARAATTNKHNLSTHYGVHYRTVLRWIAETGITPARIVSPPRFRRPAKARPAKGPVRAAAHRSFAGPKSAFCAILPRDYSLEGMAADHLRKWAPVYRCSERGGVPEDKSRLTHWRYGNAILTPAEMIERARGKGFDERTWERIAA
jgi:transposase